MTVEGSTPMTPPLACKMCRRPFATADVKLELGLAFCSTCNTVRDLPPNAVARLLGAPEVLLPPRSLSSVPPEIFTVEEIPGALVVKWQISPVGPLVGIVPLVMAALMAAALDDLTLAAAVPFLFCTVPLALGFGYLLVANLKNFSRLEVRPEQLVHVHGPLPVPWRRRASVERDQVVQLFCRRYAVGKRSYNFELMAIMKHGADDVCVVDGFRKAEHVLFLERLLERKLNIKDGYVDGELPRNLPKK